VNIGNLLQLVGMELPRTTISNRRGGINLQLYFQPLVSRLNEPVNIFDHILNEQSQIVSQRDFLSVPVTSWDTRITFIQEHYVGIPD
jgi:hypothetical protein